MARKRYKPEEIVAKLRQAAVGALAPGAGLGALPRYSLQPFTPRAEIGAVQASGADVEEFALAVQAAHSPADAGVG
jgi:hypothetical protein